MSPRSSQPDQRAGGERPCNGSEHSSRRHTRQNHSDLPHALTDSRRRSNLLGPRFDGLTDNNCQRPFTSAPEMAQPAPVSARVLGPTAVSAQGAGRRSAHRLRLLPPPDFFAAPLLLPPPGFFAGGFVEDADG